MRLIDANALIERIKEEKKECENIWYKAGICIVEEYINDAPTVEPLWDEMLVICDNCGHAIHVKKDGDER